MLSWSTLEYEEKERNADWFWALGIVVLASSVASIIYGNYFFAILLIISGMLLGFFAIKKPEMVTYELGEKGLKVQNRLFPYENIKSFFVQSSLTSNLKDPKPMLFIKSERAIIPIITISIDEENAEEIRNFLLGNNVPEEVMKEHPSSKIMETLGF